MEIKETAKFRLLSNAIQNTFGNSSEQKYLSHYVKARIIDDKKMSIMVVMTVMVGHKGIEMELRRKWIKEGFEVASAWAKKIEEKYEEAVEDRKKIQEPKVEPYEKAAPKKISLKPDPQSITDSIEYLTYSIYNPNKPALLRVHLIVDIA